MEFKLGAWANPVSLFKSEEDIKKSLELMHKYNFSFLVTVVKPSEGFVHFKSELADVSPYGKEFDFMKYLTKYAKEYDIRVHGWFCVFPEGLLEPKGFLKKHPECAAIDEWGNKIGWACPSHEESQDYEYSLIEEFVSNYDVDGVHLDYIRYPEIDVYRACVCEKCGGKLDYTNKDWIMNRVNNITKFVERVHRLARSYNIEVSAAVFPNQYSCIIVIGQDWISWCRKGLLDWVAPMNYGNSTFWVIHRSKIHRSLVSTKLYEGIGKKTSVSSLNPKDLYEQVKGVKEVGADGAIIFTLNVLTEEDMKLLKELTE